MNRTIRLLAAALVLSLAALAAPAIAATTHSENHHVTVHASNGAGHYASTFWYRGNARARTGHDLLWVKPTNVAVEYHTTHYIFHPRLYCEPEGELSYYLFRVYVWNPTTGYNHHQTIHVACHHDGSNTVTKGMTHWPRCYMAWDDDTDTRSSCYLRVTVERVNWGPNPNGHDTVIRKIRIAPFHSTSR